MDVHAYMSRVPEIGRFLTVDELTTAIEGLAARCPGILRIREGWFAGPFSPRRFHRGVTA